MASCLVHRTASENKVEGVVEAAGSDCRFDDPLGYFHSQIRGQLACCRIHERWHNLSLAGWVVLQEHLVLVHYIEC